MGPTADMDALEKTKFHAPLANRETNPWFFSPNLGTILTTMSVILDYGAINFRKIIQFPD